MAATKSGIPGMWLRIPDVPSDLVQRPRLTAELERALSSKLTLLSAPAGFGKTVLASEWLRARDQPGLSTAWVSLEESDNDAARFLRRLVAALGESREGIGEASITSLGFPELESADSAMAALANEMEKLPGELLVVLDDYHLIEEPAVHSSVAYLLDHLPANVHLLIASRSDPPLPVARLRARGELVEVHAADLAFNLDEAEDFLSQRIGSEASTEEISALHSRTEGWPAGLRLAAASLKDHQDVAKFLSEFTGSHRFVFDYLAEEVMNRESEQVQAFLLQTSILGRLSGPLCDAVTERSDGQALLERLDRANLFLIPLDDERRWYRYHHLFQDFLVTRLDRNELPLASDLHLRAAHWFEKQSQEWEAVSHAVQGKDFAYAADLLERTVEEMWGRGEVSSLVRWIDALPSAIAHARPRLCLYKAWAMVFLGRRESADEQLGHAERAIGVLGDERDPGIRVLRGQVASIRALTARAWDDIDGGIQLSRQALELLPSESLVWRSLVELNLGSAHWMNDDLEAATKAFKQAVVSSESADALELLLMSTSRLAGVQVFRGNLEQAAETYRRSLQVAKDRSLNRLPAAGLAHVGLGLIHYEWNDLVAAERHLNEGIELGKSWWNANVLGSGYASLARVEWAKGKSIEAQAIMDELETLARERFTARVIANVAASRVRLWLADGELGPASSWARDSGLSLRDIPDYPRWTQYTALARVAVAEGMADQAGPLLDRLLTMAEGAGRIGQMIEVLLFQTWAYLTRAEHLRATSATLRALELSAAHGYVRAIADEGPPVTQLVERFRNEPELSKRALGLGVTHQYLERVAAAMALEGMDNRSGRARGGATQMLPEPLTDREIEVLGLIAAGYSNQEIASVLFVALSTVKTHINKIYGKIGASRRTEAIARARRLGLVD